MLATAPAWEQDGIATGDGRERLGAVAATCWEQMLRGWQAGPPGSSGPEAVPDERTAATGHARVEARRTARGTEVLARVRDRAKAVLPRAAPGWACLRRPACLPLVPERVKRAALALGGCPRNKPLGLSGQSGRTGEGKR